VLLAYRQIEGLRAIKYDFFLFLSFHFIKEKKIVFKMKLLLLTLSVVMVVRLVASIGADLGTCSCMCGVGETGGVLGPGGRNSPSTVSNNSLLINDSTLY